MDYFNQTLSLYNCMKLVYECELMDVVLTILKLKYYLIDHISFFFIDQSNLN